MNNSTSNYILLIVAGSFWIVWTHYRLQRAKQTREMNKKLQTTGIELTGHDGNIILAGWAAVGAEKVLLFNELWKRMFISTDFTKSVALDALLNLVAMAVYGTGIVMMTKKMQWNHLTPLVNITLLHLAFHSLSFLPLPIYFPVPPQLSGMLVMIFLNSIARNFIVPYLTNATVKNTNVDKSSVILSIIGSVKNIEFTIVIFSFVFYYSQENWCHIVFQLLICWWSAMDIYRFFKSRTTTNSIQQNNSTNSSKLD